MSRRKKGDSDVHHNRRAAAGPRLSASGLYDAAPLVSFFTLAYALTWLAWSPWYLSESGVSLLSFDAEGISDYLIDTRAYLVRVRHDGRDRGERRYTLPAAPDRAVAVGLRWYLFALVGIPAIVLLSTIVLPGALGSFRSSAVVPTLFVYVVAGPVFLFAGGPVFEEIGWRGFTLPRLQRLYGPLTGPLVLGAFWDLWHLPLFLIPVWDTPHRSLPDVALFVVLAMSIAIVITWIFNNTRQSVLLAILAHGSINSAAVSMYTLFPADVVTGGIANVAVGSGATSLLIVGLTGGAWATGEKCKSPVTRGRCKLIRTRIRMRVRRIAVAEGEEFPPSPGWLDAG